jgi:outer membrane protein, heavy metal efflux system
MKRSHLHWRWLASSATVLGMSVFTGCVHYHPKPLDPARNLTLIESRSVDDPKLKVFLETNGIQISSPPKWDLHALTLVAFYFHPDLDDARAAAAVSRGAVITAGQRPNPQISPSLTLDTTTSPAWIPSLGLLIPIETAGKRGHRLAQARNLERAAQLRVVRVAWDVRSRVRRTLIDYLAARRAEEVLGREQAIQDQIVDLLVRQLDAGAVTPFEVTQARLAAANTRLAANQVALQRSSATAALADALGLSSQAFEPMAPLVDAGDFSGIQVPGENARRQALMSRTDVLAALSDYEASQASLQLEIARQYPDLQLGPGYMLDQTDNKWTLVGLNVTLPVFNRNQGPIAEAEARRQQAAAQLLSVQSTALRQVSEAVGSLGAARKKLTTAQSLVATARQQEQRARARYELGDITRQEVLTAQLEVVSNELALSDAQLQADQAAGALEDAMQSPLGFENIVLKNPRP